MPQANDPHKAAAPAGWRARLAARPLGQQALALLVLSAAASALLLALHLPAAVLVACMAVAISLATGGVRLALPRSAFMLAQAILGCLMARSLNLPTLRALAQNWPVFVGATLLIVLASAALGWVITRRGLLPGSTAVWGLAPGAASAMVVMCERWGADMRLVAFMQYTRVVTVTVLAALVARAAGVVGQDAPATPGWLAWWLPAQAPGWGVADLWGTLGLVALGVAVARRWGLPGSAMVLPLVLATALQAAGLGVVALPPLALNLAYALIGWSVGLRYTPAIWHHALRLLPVLLAAIVLLIAVGLGSAWWLVAHAGLDPLTAYLATSPGGADSVAVIAATSAVQTGFVMSMQVGRFLLVLLIGPPLTRWVAQRAAPPPPPPGPPPA